MSIKRLQDIDNWSIKLNEFIQTLSEEDKDSKVYLNVKWQEKIIKHGDIFVSYSEHSQQIIGWILIYCNNINTLTAYCAGLNVLKEYRGQKIGKLLLAQAVNLCKKNKFKVLTLYCSPKNNIALNLYKAFGFKERNIKKDELNLFALDLE